jgi:periplasmic protein TonB
MPNPSQNLTPDMISNHDGVNFTTNNWLPWDYGQFRKSDSAFIIVAILLCIVIPLITVPKILIKIPQRTVLPPVEIAIPLVQPKPVIEPPPTKQKSSDQSVSQKTPRATAPSKPRASNQKPAVQNAEPVAAVQPSAADMQAAAQRRAQGLVASTGLGSAIGSLTGDSTNPKSVDGRSLVRGGIAGERSDVKLDSGSGPVRSGGVRFGSATEGDKTGRGVGNLSVRGTGDASVGAIKDRGMAISGNGIKNVPGGRQGSEFASVMLKNTGTLRGAYKRALDEDPSMGGDFVVRVKIAPDGRVISASVVSSELNNSALESKLIAIIKGFQFAPAGNENWEKNYTYNFSQ